MAESSVMLWVVIVVCGIFGIAIVVGGILLMASRHFQKHRRKCSGITEEEENEKDNRQA